MRNDVATDDDLEAKTVNGAESLARTLVAGGVDVCFANPGTSEMHFVAALDKVDGIRCVLVLFEGVATAAADGYYRMTRKPAATLLHLGPGLGNALANIHNSRKAHSGVVNIVGDHAAYHLRYDAPLTADIEGIARPVSHWLRTTKSADEVSGDGAEAIAQARAAPGRISTLVLPADTAWTEAGPLAAIPEPAAPEKVDDDAVEAAARALETGEASMLLLGGTGLTERTLLLAGKIAAKTGCRLMSEPQFSLLQRGVGRVAMERFPYAHDLAQVAIAGVSKLVLAGAKAPIAFFAYPEKPSSFVPEGCDVVELAKVEQDIAGAVEALALRLGAMDSEPVGLVAPPPANDPFPNGPVTLAGAAEIVRRLMPEDSVIVDDANTSGRPMFQGLQSGPHHDWCSLMGGGIGWGLPAAIGAAIGAPGRQVITLEGDGSGMYAVSALWTMAREKLKIVNIIFANRTYQILHGELEKVGASNPGPKALDMLNLDRPTIDWPAIARGQGVGAGRAETLDQFKEEFEKALATDGPYLIELVL